MQDELIYFKHTIEYKIINIMLNIKDKAINELLSLKISSREDMMALKRKIAKKYKISIPQNSDILKRLSAGKGDLKNILRKRSVRTLSGIAPVAVLTKPFACPGKCAYCPTEKDVPQSYLSNEPAVMRAIRCDYDPYKQVQLRLKALEANGHEPTKIELIVIGGTWSVLPVEYKYWYLLNCYKAANDYANDKKSGVGSKKISEKVKISRLRGLLSTEQKRNERAKYKLIGVTLETRPDYIDESELWQMRELGCTRVELGVQAIDDKILDKNLRGHGVAKIAEATKLLKDFGFKVTYHLMPGLPGSTAAKDLKMFKQLFSDERFQPDQLKFYPTVVTKGSLLYKWWRQGKYKPYSDRVLQKLIIDCKKIVPSYVRIIRLIRDIPGESIVAGNIITNLRQVMQQKGIECNCIRCREARDKKVKNYKLQVISYKASGGEEYFIEACSKDGKILYGFCRLRLSSHNVERITHNAIKNSALIRELHVYGKLVPVGPSATSSGSGQAGSGQAKVQHTGLGRLLMAEAEKIAKKNNFQKIAVISGVGVRGYYRKLGYKLQDTYIVKKI